MRPSADRSTVSSEAECKVWEDITAPAAASMETFRRTQTDRLSLCGLESLQLSDRRDSSHCVKHHVHLPVLHMDTVQTELYATSHAYLWSITVSLRINTVLSNLNTSIYFFWIFMKKSFVFKCFLFSLWILQSAGMSMINHLSVII